LFLICWPFRDVTSVKGAVNLIPSSVPIIVP
jgi:hypothetical protein